MQQAWATQDSKAAKICIHIMKAPYSHLREEIYIASSLPRLFQHHIFSFYHKRLLPNHSLTIRSYLHCTMNTHAVWTLSNDFKIDETWNFGAGTHSDYKVTARRTGRESGCGWCCDTFLAWVMSHSVKPTLLTTWSRILLWRLESIRRKRYSPPFVKPNVF